MSQATLRQRLVPEIGDEGQARIGATVIDVVDAPGLTGEITARYLEHAGFAEVRSRPASIRGHRSLLADVLSRDVLAEADPAVVAIAVGAAIAIDHIRRGARGES